MRYFFEHFQLTHNFFFPFDFSIHEMELPIPDFSDDDDELFPLAPLSPLHHTAPVRTLKESLSHTELFSLAQSCDPDTTFNAQTSTGLLYDIENPIYKTKTCTLFLAKEIDLNSDEKYYALKTSSSSKLLLHEWDVYSRIGKFPTIIDASRILKEPNNTMFIQLDYAFGGSIANTALYFDVFDAWRIFAHIASALCHIHSQGFIHLDVSPANILQCDGANGANIFKLTDFGTVLKNGTFENFCEGAGPYVSPEALYWPNSPHQVTYQTDIWSFGAVMYEIVTHRKVPRDAERYDAIRKGTFDLSIIPDEFDIVRQMLKVDPSQRPTSLQLIQHPKIKDILERLQYEVIQPQGNQGSSMPSKNSMKGVCWLDDEALAKVNDFKRRQSFDCI
ncbi:TKL family protein kinase [Tritrichomonas foetus]|uniref:TKL family protein kinase n=1 Tax=Tritrichomonas foetus TaxID=1144522 RepID=A0A1J4JRQ9_9EUKA|nr:TKL family protein kinase [Tritrichomonas foetus]|eukprot:OHS99932.1 TKL family protein kinase [Tritrichomonas foetus]